MRVALPEMPQSVQQTLGPEVADALGQWFKAILFEQDLRYDEYQEILWAKVSDRAQRATGASPKG